MPQQSISLFFTEGSSDKEYHIHMKEQDDGFVVYGMNGRRGGSLKMQPKTDGKAISEADANSIYSSLLKTQLKKGYSPMESGIKFEGTEHAGRVTGLLPQLSNEIGMAEAERLINDDGWMAQQKGDGERRPFGVGANGAFGANRQGLAVPIPVPVAQALQALGVRVHLDGESMGAYIFAFDLTELDGGDWRHRGAEDRYRKLAELVEALDPIHRSAIVLAPAAFTAQEKRALLEGCQHHCQEGLVFKRKEAPYVADRPVSGGDSLKLKFWAHADVVLGDLNTGKRSAPIHGFDAAGVKVPLGNVTIPNNVLTPARDSVHKVKYLYAFEKGSLFEPTYAGPSLLPMDQCKTVGLKYKAAHVDVDPQDFLQPARRMRP